MIMTEGTHTVDKGTHLVKGNAKVMACGCATVRAFGDSIVIASDNAIVYAYGDAKVIATDDTVVVAFGDAVVEARDHANVSLHDCAKGVLCGRAVGFAYDSTTITTYDETRALTFEFAKLANVDA